MNLFVKLLLILLFDSYSVIFIVPSILYIIGTAFIFKKSGIKWYFALIPCVREYQLARCAYREPEGRVCRCPKPDMADPGSGRVSLCCRFSRN